LKKNNFRITSSHGRGTPAHCETPSNEEHGQLVRSDAARKCCAWRYTKYMPVPLPTLCMDSQNSDEGRLSGTRHRALHLPSVPKLSSSSLGGWSYTEDSPHRLGPEDSVLGSHKEKHAMEEAMAESSRL
jgi:hypothetical protein